jgi:hypothetical protein
MASTTRRGPLWPAALLVAVAIAFAAMAVATGGAAREVAARRTSTADRPTELITMRPPGQIDAAVRARDVRPVRLVVPAAGVDSRLVPLGLLPDGAMEVPADAAVAGWYSPGPSPGEPGPAVLAGHVDSKLGPGVFIHLDDLAAGEPNTVERQDGTQYVFTVTAVEQHPKEALPVDRIWAPSAEPTLRLVTCGGTFDRRTGHYTDNVVVFAELSLVRNPQQALRHA